MLSACLIVRDGAKTLARCLNSLNGLVDEILVVIDPRTHDNSPQIASGFGARIYYRPFDNFASQKNFAVSKSAGPWILSLDADEVIPPKLKNEIQHAIYRSNYDAYYLPRLNRIFGRSIYHSNWGPKEDSHIWLFKKSAAHWVGQVHEEVVVRGKVGRLRNYKLHNSYQTVSEFIEKLNYYTSFHNNQNFSFSAMWLAALKDFFRRFIWHRGFLDSYHGLFLAYLMVIYHLTIYIKTWQKESSR